MTQVLAREAVAVRQIPFLSQTRSGITRHNPRKYGAINENLYILGSQAKLSSLPDGIESTGKVLIRRRDGRIYALVPEGTSPLDVPSIKAEISTEEIVSIIRSERERNRARR